MIETQYLATLAVRSKFSRYKAIQDHVTTQEYGRHKSVLYIELSCIHVMCLVWQAICTKKTKTDRKDDSHNFWHRFKIITWWKKYKVTILTKRTPYISIRNLSCMLEFVLYPCPVSCMAGYLREKKTQRPIVRMILTTSGIDSKYSLDEKSIERAIKNLSCTSHFVLYLCPVSCMSLFLLKKKKKTAYKNDSNNFTA